MTKKAALFSTNNHSQSTVDIVTNGVYAGKLTHSMAEALLSSKNDENSVNVTS